MNLIDYVKNNYVLYILGDKDNVKNFCQHPFDIEMCYIDPLRESGKLFADLLIKVDGVGYGNKDLGMEKWVALDCGMLPSAFIGLAKRVDDLSAEIKAKISLPKGYNALVPVTMYCAIPAVQQGLWISHSLASIDNGKGLGLVTKIIGLMVYRVEKMRGIAQYDNYSIRIHSRIADLKLVSAMTFVHNIPDMTFVYEYEVDQNRLMSVLNSKKVDNNPSFLLDPNDIKKKKEMQKMIEKNVRDFYVVHPGKLKGNGLVPILEKEK